MFTFTAVENVSYKMNTINLNKQLCTNMHASLPQRIKIEMKLEDPSSFRI